MSAKIMTCLDHTQLTDWISVIKADGLLTGTSLYGPLTPESDEDYVVTCAWLKETTKVMGLKSPKKEPSKYNLMCYSYKYRPDEKDRWVNLLVVEDNKSLLAWEYASLQMLLIDPIWDKSERAKTFEKHLTKAFCFMGLKNRSPDIVKGVEWATI